MRAFEAVLFDIDGTLLDTTEFIFQAYESTLKTFKLPMISRTEISLLIGKSLERCYELMTGLSDVKELCTAHRSFQASHVELSKPYPKTINTLDALRDAGIRIAAVTTRTRATVDETLKAGGINKYMEYVVAMEDVEHLKPHPEPLLKALQYLNMAPSDAVMVGDTDVDVLAGKNAGTATVGATYGFHGAHIIESKPDYVIDDIGELIPLVLPLLEYQL